MIQPQREWQEFTSGEEKLKKLKELKIISPKAKTIKDLYYKGLYTQEPIKCDVIGIVDDTEIIININGQAHSIHPAYFQEMQKKKFSL